MLHYPCILIVVQSVDAVLPLQAALTPVKASEAFTLQLQLIQSIPIVCPDLDYLRNENMVERVLDDRPEYRTARRDETAENFQRAEKDGRWTVPCKVERRLPARMMIDDGCESPEGY